MLTSREQHFLRHLVGRKEAQILSEVLHDDLDQVVKDHMRTVFGGYRHPEEISIATGGLTFGLLSFMAKALMCLGQTYKGIVDVEELALIAYELAAMMENPDHH